ncbi:hypothetical protein LCGC14_2656780, partial [marine sediment metagenome]
SIGHTGAIIPTAKLKPVHLMGVTVTSALLNNFEEIERLGVAVGDEVRVIRAGDVIPKIIGVAQHSMPPDFDPNGWVDCRIRCVGPRIQYWLNGHKTIDYLEEDTQIPRKGSIGLQFHSWSAHAFEVQFKDIRIKELK